MSPSIPTPSVPPPCPWTLLHNYCVLCRTSTMPVKEPAAMQVHPARAAPPLDPEALIAPHQLWGHLSRSQQQWLAHLPSQPPRAEEATHAPRSPAEPSENHPTPS